MMRALAAFALVLTILAVTHLSFPASLIAVAAVIAACLALAWLIATGLGRLVDSSPRYRTAPDWSTA
jgi:hypothetical protein